MESQGESQLCLDIWRSVSKSCFLALRSWFLASCAQFVSNSKQMGLCPAPTQLQGPQRAVEGLPPSDQAERPPRGVAQPPKHHRGPHWEVQACISQETGRPDPTLAHVSVTACGLIVTTMQMLFPPHQETVSKPSG